MLALVNNGLAAVIVLLDGVASLFTGCVVILVSAGLAQGSKVESPNESRWDGLDF